jgi:hypothetical protein
VAPAQGSAFTVHFEEMDNLLKALTGIRDSFSKLPGHQPVDHAALGDGHLADELQRFLDGWKTGRQHIEKELDGITKHVQMALQEYVAAEGAVTHTEGDVAHGSLQTALAGGGKVLTRVVDGTEVHDPTFTPTRGLAGRLAAADQAAAHIDADVIGDVSQPGEMLGPNAGPPVAHEVVAATDQAERIDQDVYRDLTGEPGTPDAGGGVHGVPDNPQPVQFDSGHPTTGPVQAPLRIEPLDPAGVGAPTDTTTGVTDD